MSSIAGNDDAFRQKIRVFLDEQVPEGFRGLGTMSADDARAFATRWRVTLHEHGLLAASWPKQFGGGGLTEREQVILAEEFYRVGVPTGTDNDTFGIQMVGNTILAWGTEAQREYFLPKILSGEHLWCQGYSEPNAGSDLGNVGTRAERDGDEWVINGQKIWTSAGHLANHIFVLARTNPDAPKHKGITFLLVPMNQPGIEVRPIKMMTGDAEFNEVFFTDARCPVENVVGEVNGGWPVAMTLLGYERGEAAAVFPIMFKMEFDRLVQLVKELDLSADPLVRQQMARLFEKVEIMRFLGMRSLEQFLAGKPPAADASIFKLYWSEYHQQVTECAVSLFGLRATAPQGRPPMSSFHTDQRGAPNSTASWVGSMYVARAGTIYAGTSQVQRNIIGELVLGLPKEPAGPRGTWRELAQGQSTS
ncbi:MAG: acyl-CoA dehydrogenase family protein [Actinomycetes bacterium]